MATNPPKKAFIYNYRDAYAEYKKLVPELERIPWKKYKAFLYDFMKEIVRKLIYESFVWNIPNQIGTIYIKQTKRKNPVFVFNGNKRIKTRNYHTFQKIFKIYYNKEYSLIKNKSWVKLIPSISMKKLLTDEIRRRAKDPRLEDYSAY